MKVIFSFILVSLLLSCAGPFEVRKTKWTVPEVEEWYKNYSAEPGAWDGILYQGSDDEYHHFIARVQWVDNWVIIQIRKEDLALGDEEPYLKSLSSSPFAYYYVDPSNKFIKVRDIEENNTSSKSN